MTFAWSWSDVPGGMPPVAFHSGFEPATPEMIAAYQKDEVTCRQVGERFGCSGVTAWRRLKAAGVAMRVGGRRRAV